jgi:hypothetical protein
MNSILLAVQSSSSMLKIPKLRRREADRLYDDLIAHMRLIHHTVSLFAQIPNHSGGGGATVTILFNFRNAPKKAIHFLRTRGR